MSPTSTVKTLRIDGRDVTGRHEESILDVARQNNIFIPRLCEMDGLSDVGACRLCLVEIKGQNKLLPACVTSVEEGMEVTTDSERLQNYRRMTNLGARARLRCDCDQALRPRSARLRLPRSETWTSLRRSCRRDAGNWVDGNPEYGFTATTSLTGPCTFRPRRQASFLKRLRLTSDTVTFAS